MSQKNLKKLKTSRWDRSISALGIGIRGGVIATKYTLDKVRGRASSPDKYLLEAAELLTEELDKLKGSLHKAGQLLSVFGEFFLPEEALRVLEKLQANTTPVEWKLIEKTLKRSLGSEILSELEIEPQPFAAASMGQVYLAKYEGNSIVLKIQYPGIDRSIKSDIDTLRTLFKITNLLPDAEAFQEIFDEIRLMLIRETDYALELETMEATRKRLPDNGPFVIPETYAHLSSKRVLAMNYIEGVNFADPSLQLLSQERRNLLGYALLDLLFKEMFEWKTIQSDAHPGNYLIQTSDSGDKLVLLDFGAVRKFPDKFMDAFKKMSLATLNRDYEEVIRQGKKLDYLRESDSDEACKVFYDICCNSLTGFMPDVESPSIDGKIWEEKNFHWHENSVITHMAGLAKSAIFKSKMRPPPKEAIFLDRKIAGVFAILSRLKVIYGPGKLLRNYSEK